MKAMRRRLGALSATVAALTCAVGAVDGCNFDDSSSANPYNGPDATMNQGDDSSTGGGGDAGQLCTTYGGATQVKALADSIVGNVIGDCRIGGYFANLSSTDSAHFKACFGVYVQSLFQCPGITYAGAKDLNGQPCRDMAKAHEGLGITDSDFLAFMNDVISSLTAAKVTQTDQNTIINALNGVQNVYNNKEGNYQCTCANNMGCVEGGVDADASDTGTDGGQDTGTDSGGGGMDSGGGSDGGASQDAGGD